MNLRGLALLAAVGFCAGGCPSGSDDDSGSHGTESYACTTDGEQETRKRYEAETADAECKSETQERTCNDGTWSDWTGTYTFEACEVEPDGQDDSVTSCDMRTLGQVSLQYCSEFHGMDPETIGCAGGDKIDGECSRDGAKGYCQSQSIGDAFSKTLYYDTDAADAAKTICTGDVGTWHDL